MRDALIWGLAIVMVLAMIAIFGNLLRIAAREKAEHQNAKNLTLPETVFCLLFDAPEGEPPRIVADRRNGQDYALLFEEEADAEAFLAEAQARKEIAARIGSAPLKGIRFAQARYKPAGKPPVDILI